MGGTAVGGTAAVGPRWRKLRKVHEYVVAQQVFSAPFCLVCLTFCSSSCKAVVEEGVPRLPSPSCPWSCRTTFVLRQTNDEEFMSTCCSTFPPAASNAPCSTVVSTVVSEGAKRVSGWKGLRFVDVYM